MTFVFGSHCWLHWDIFTVKLFILSPQGHPCSPFHLKNSFPLQNAVWDFDETVPWCWIFYSKQFQIQMTRKGCFCVGMTHFGSHFEFTEKKHSIRDRLQISLLILSKFKQNLNKLTFGFLMISGGIKVN